MCLESASWRSALFIWRFQSVIFHLEYLYQRFAKYDYKITIIILTWWVINTSQQTKERAQENIGGGRKCQYTTTVISAVLSAKFIWCYPQCSFFTLRWWLPEHLYIVKPGTRVYRTCFVHFLLLLRCKCRTSTAKSRRIKYSPVMTSLCLIRFWPKCHAEPYNTEVTECHTLIKNTLSHIPQRNADLQFLLFFSGLHRSS